MLVLFETPAGYAVYKVQDEKKLQQTENIFEDFKMADGVSKVVELMDFRDIKTPAETLAVYLDEVDGLTKKMTKLVVSEALEQLATADLKFGNAIKNPMSIECVQDTNIAAFVRFVHAQADKINIGLPLKELSATPVPHGLSRYKLKFSPDKIDIMVTQAISLLDDLDKELNNYNMRCREWYGWHFPELENMITDNLTFVKTVRALGVRTNAEHFDYTQLMLPKELQDRVKEAAEISMGIEISEEDTDNIMFLCDQVIEMTQYRSELFDFLRNRMLAIAPRLTELVGAVVGARLVSHAGSLMKLSKLSASKVHLMGTETDRVIFHAEIVTSANSTYKKRAAWELSGSVVKSALADIESQDDDRKKRLVEEIECSPPPKSKRFKEEEDDTELKKDGESE